LVLFSAAYRGVAFGRAICLSFLCGPSSSVTVPRMSGESVITIVVV
jgi:hypothetical protein